ncbi:MAG: AMP-binding protein, partial [Bifidobacteriaceae bacterium]|nr:AMP-binding protein [Bifidobacteriaceae bacterium]
MSSLAVDPQTLSDITRRSAGRYPHKIALIDGDTVITFAQLDQMVDAAAAAMQEAGLVPGDVLALLSRNSWQLAVLPFAANRAGVILAPVNFLLSATEVAAALELVQPKAFIAEEHLIEVAQEALNQANLNHPTASSNGQQVLRYGIGPGKRAQHHGWADLNEWLNHPGKPGPVPQTDSDVVRLMFTSGTEARPKAVQLTNRSLMWQYMSTVVSGGMASNDIDLHFMPLYHCAQLDVFLIPDLYLGATSVILRSAGPAPILRAIQEHQITKMFATPSKWIELLNAPGFDPSQLAGVTKGYYGAAAMPVPVLTEMAE